MFLAVSAQYCSTISCKSLSERILAVNAAASSGLELIIKSDPRRSSATASFCSVLLFIFTTRPDSYFAIADF
uniref:Uncharacterized protein n=1 Tax=Siphoviridae sp. ctDmR33 TaxID=2825389 RepID=A0A8S5UXE0_9CAUD|nr:MAG TPA: hypothetical protein [Siphoviridae sp. ctDmR33]DAO19891.1 MAG TPA: hypothetical protein [Caudoviricetes sp.]